MAKESEIVDDERVVDGERDVREQIGRERTFRRRTRTNRRKAFAPNISRSTPQSASATTATIP